MKEVYNYWMNSPDNEMTIRRELNVPPNIKIQPQHCTIYLNILYDRDKENASAPFNLDSKIKVQRFLANGKSRYAIIPESHGIFSDIFSFMNEDKDLTDIWFDENALATKEFLNEHNVSEDEWVERAEIYIERLESPYDVLTMEVVNNKIIFEIDPNLDNLVDKILIDNESKEDIIKSETEPNSEELEDEISESEQLAHEEEDEEEDEEYFDDSDEDEINLDFYDDSEEITEEE